MENIVARWEWRTFGHDFGPAERRSRPILQYVLCMYSFSSRIALLAFLSCRLGSLRLSTSISDMVIQSEAVKRRAKGVPGFFYGALAPTLVVVFVVVALPLLFSLYLSFNVTNPITKRWAFVGLSNYVKLLGSAEFWDAYGRTAYFATLTVGGTTLLGTLIALVLNQTFPFRGFLRSVVLVPWAMAPVSIGVLWSFIFAGNVGLLNGLLNDLGLQSLATAWLGNGFRALNLVALTNIWNQAPLTALLLLAGLQSMPANLHKAAILDGAGPVRRFFAITLPWLKSNYLFITVIATINALMTFDILWIMTRGGPGNATTVLSWLGYIQSFQFLRFGEGAATLYVLTLTSLGLAALYFFAFGRRRSRATASVSDADEGHHFRGSRRNPMASLPLTGRAAGSRFRRSGSWAARDLPSSAS